MSRGKLLAKRLALRLNQRQVSDRAGLKYGPIELGIRHFVSPDAARRIAAALECRVEDIARRGAAEWRGVPDDSLLGTVSDARLARKWRLPVSAVYSQRAQLGIKAFQARKKRSIPDPSLLGKMPDQQLADLLSLPRHVIAYRRILLGIPAFAAEARRTEGVLPASPTSAV